MKQEEGGRRERKEEEEEEEWWAPRQRTAKGADTHPLTHSSLIQTESALGEPLPGPSAVGASLH